jgi:hypothetical protein
MVIQQPRLPRDRASIDDELEASSLALFWGGHLARAEADIESAKWRREFGLPNYIAALERLVPYREGEPGAKSGENGKGKARAREEVEESFNVKMDDGDDDSGVA